MSSELQGTVNEAAGLRGEISVGDTDVLVAIANYIKDLDLPNTYDAKGSADEVKTLLEQYKTSNDSVVSEIANNVLGILNGENINSFADVESALINYVTSDSFKLSIYTLAALIGTIPDGAASDNVADYVKELVDAEDNKIQLAFDGLVNSINAYIESNNEKVDRNALAITDIKDGESIDSFKDVENALAKKQPTGDYATKEEAKRYADAKDAAIAEAKQIGTDNSDSIDKLTSDLITKANQSDLDRTNDYLDALFKLNRGQTWDTQEAESNAYAVDVPSGTHYASVDMVGGKSIVWNQLVSYDLITLTNANKTISGSKLTATINTMPTSEWDSCATFNHSETIIGHKYLCKGIFGVDRTVVGMIEACGEYMGVDLTNGDNPFARILTASQVRSKLTIYPKLITGGYVTNDSFSVTNLQLFDLTQRFGAGNEPATVEEAYQRGIPREYVPYCEPTIISSQTDRVDVRGRNLLPVQTSFNNRISLFFPSGTKLFASCKNDGIGAERVAYFRQDKTQIDYWGLNDLGNGRKGRAFTAEEDIYYIAIFSNNGSQYIMTDQQLEYGTTATEYSPYSLQQITTGFPTLNEFDSIELNDSKLITGGAFLDMGTLNWEYSGTIFYAVDERFFATTQNLLCSIYNNKVGTDDKSVYAVNGVLRVIDSSYTDATAFKTAMSGVMLYYELAEPVITDIEIPSELADWLTVEAGGSITFHNADDGKRLLIPNKETFIRKLDEVV